MITERHGGMILTGEPEELGEKPVPIPLSLYLLRDKHTGLWGFYVRTSCYLFCYFDNFNNQQHDLTICQMIVPERPNAKWCGLFHYY
jgi:hypothetical protein